MSFPSEVRIPEGVMARQVAEEVVILDLSSGNYYGLDPVGARMWNLFAAGKAPPEVLQSMLGEYDVTFAQLEEDMIQWVTDLAAKGLLQIK